MKSQSDCDFKEIFYIFKGINITYSDLLISNRNKRKRVHMLI